MSNYDFNLAEHEATKNQALADIYKQSKKIERVKGGTKSSGDIGSLSSGMGVAAGMTGIFSNFMNDMDSSTNGAGEIEASGNSLYKETKDSQDYNVEADNLDALANMWSNNRSLKNDYDQSDFYNGPGAEESGIMGGISGLASGLSSGLSSGSGPVAIATSLLGTAFGAIGGYNKGKAKEDAARIAAQNMNSLAQSVQRQKEMQMAAQAENLSNKNNMLAEAQIAAYGGQLNGYGGNWTNGLTFINNGSTHEGNPYGGVPIGTAPDGQPNLVEEGEIIWNDYVFSNRLTVPDDIRAKYKLGRKKDLTYADAVEKLQKASKERPNDEIEKRGLDSALNELAQSQEGVRQAKQQQEAFNQQEALASMFADGGDIHINKNKRGTFTAAATKHKMGVQEFASHVLSNKDRFSPEMVKKANFARNASHWAHAYGGSLFAHGGPLGYMFDGTGDNFNYIIPQPKPPVDPDAENIANSYKKPWSYNPLYSPIYSDGELMGYQHGDKTLAPLITTPGGTPYTPQQTTYRENGQTPITANTIPHAYERPGTKTETETETETTGGGKGFKWDESYLRFAPILSSAINTAVSLLDKPNYRYADAIDNAVGNQKVDNISFNPIGDYLAYRPLDRLFYANELSAQNAANSRNIINLSNGNSATAMAGLLANNYNTNVGLGKLYRQGAEYNFNQRKDVTDFNRGTNIFNSEQGLKAQMANADLRDKHNARAYDAAVKSNMLRQAEDNQIQANRSAALTGLFDNIGNVGWEAFNRNMINSDMSKYYSIDNTGKVNYKKDYWDLSKEEQAKIDDEVKSRNKPQSKRSSYTRV